MKTAGVLLAAGASQRFGAQDKLLTDLGGRPMVSYAANALRGLDLDYKIAVISNQAVRAELPDFQCVTRTSGTTTQSASLKTAIQGVNRHEVDRVVIVLGDMPFVTSSTLRKLLSVYSTEHGCGSINGHRLSPPASFPRHTFNALMAQSGDQGARALLRMLPKKALLPLSDIEAADIDTQDQIALYTHVIQTR